MKRALALTLLGAAALARADLPPQPLLPAYKAECGACHVAYPPALLPADSWKRLMVGLDRHFGTDASLDAATARTIAAWLEANAGTYRKVRREGAAPPEDRITRAAWFRREHDEVPAATWKRADVKSPANCAACHTQADQGDFSERQIRVPR
ncbi:MAG: hypothetical protein Fur0014_17710 [Rubrivivax sp.]